MGEDKFALTPIEETKGYLGHIIEGEVDWGTPLQVLASFDWTLYGMMCDEIGADSWRKLLLKIDEKSINLSADAWEVNSFFWDIPSVDLVPIEPEYHPAAVSGYIFTLRDGFSKTDVDRHATALKSALDLDFETLREEYGKL